MAALRGRDNKALAVLAIVGGKEYAEQELQVVKASTKATKFGEGFRLLFSRPFRKVLIIGVVIAVFQQWCGTNVIFNYAQEIFQSAGYKLSDVLFNIVVTGIANVIFTFVAIYTVDRIGRRVLMLIGAGGLACIYLILGGSYFFHLSGLFMVGFCMAIACYAMTLGPTLGLLSELFPIAYVGVAWRFHICPWACLHSQTRVRAHTALESSLPLIYAFICAVMFVLFRILPRQTEIVGI